MKLQLRAIGFGLLTAMVVIAVVEAIGQMFYPAPANIDYNNKELIKELFATMPFGALVFIVNAWILGSFIGAIVTTRMHKEKGLQSALILGVLVLAFTILNMMSIPHPMWMWLSAVIGIIPGALLGYKITTIKIEN